MLFAEFERVAPGRRRGIGEPLIPDAARVERHRRDRQAFVPDGLALRGARMVAHDPQHGLPVFREARKGPELRRHLRRGRIGRSGHEGGNGATHGAATVTVVGNAAGHQQAAHIGEAKAQGSVLV